MKGLCVLSPHKKKVHYNIVQIGAGANGSHFFRGMMQDLYTHFHSDPYKFSVDVTIVDKDKIEEKNLNNQLFTRDEIGEYKVVSLVERYADHYNIAANAVVEYATDIGLLEKLFAPPEVSETTQIVPVLIGLVDNNRTRQLMDEFFHSDYLSDLIYIDAGVEGVEDGDANNTGFGGQVVVGLKKEDHVWLEPVGKLFANILEDQESVFPDQSCADAVKDNPQRCATNKFCAQIVNNVLNNLFHQNTIFTHVINFNAQLCFTQPTFIPREVILEYCAYYNMK